MKDTSEQQFPNNPRLREKTCLLAPIRETAGIMLINPWVTHPTWARASISTLQGRAASSQWTYGTVAVLYL